MNIVTILGTRPEMIRLSLIMSKLDQLADRHAVVHTGQNLTPTLHDIFFQELGIRYPDYQIKPQGYSLGSQLSAMFGEVESILLAEKPDKVLLLGDTNSALCAILAERMNIPVVHMEAGNRCFDRNVPEEKNRRVIDAVSSVNMPYTSQSKQNLLGEGIPARCIVVTGNPIYEVLTHYEPQIQASRIREQLGLGGEPYFLVTIHRAENVDNPFRLQGIMDGLNRVAESFGYRMICSTHPRTRARIGGSVPLATHPLVEFHEPFGFIDFAHLEKHALCVLTDSGTVQEECCIFHVPSVTIRTSTERPETVDCGSNIVAGVDAANIVGAVKLALRLSRNWVCPEGYLDAAVSDKVVKFVLGGM
ncbi:UDP-N-acetylglucosamine 2-epimerase (non-hydrolyzing) [Paenibacillus doosanensis]|uniref:UDP-2,3-diacetamido-2,3-dideoxy-D-glucuronate 2-epimerase n=1 Tax=Paenibacillus konkukensis TaxID=2020716 RepID=A0ABY4RYM9_9BACL|nr:MULTISPECIES: UDP-N-acetylglucosamine 2-epimerase (non-hydrolyzing) [Paenibacillus]MCS7458834.1 UDP-N-acetylglucosamine 2-epimerase (non-hydrolyzing) [Paenibacillus doosanensis]UQZ86638.1 UDP-2,3-diacetamido-2,3-dideoxy-D-glucuronate 2-epimerase [Paenibacillus konkukensis]